MSLSRTDIAQWFDQARAKGATHMLVVADTYDLLLLPQVRLRPSGSTGNRGRDRLASDDEGDGAVLHEPR